MKILKKMKLSFNNKKIIKSITILNENKFSIKKLAKEINSNSIKRDQVDTYDYVYGKLLILSKRQKRSLKAKYKSDMEISRWISLLIALSIGLIVSFSFSYSGDIAHTTSAILAIICFLAALYIVRTYEKKYSRFTYIIAVLDDVIEDEKLLK